jgi:5-methylcytosine-specific restriction endonuclease McrA
LQPSRQPDVRREKNVEYYAANREREIERALAYSRGPGRDAKRALDAARYALTRGASSAERFTLDDIFVRDAGICHLCGDLVERHGLGSLSATMDHVIPVTKGGHHTLENVKLAHRSCNTRKGNKLLL